jgi:hypothetical protein
MRELLFCNKCGNVSSSDNNEIGDRCWSCNVGKFIGTGIDNPKSYAEVIEEYKKTHNGDYPSVKESDEMLREKYFYGKLDSDVTKAATTERKYWESPEGVEEQNRITDRWYAKQNAQKFSTGPKCPTCGSTNIRKISTGERMVSVGMLGLFSKKINKSFKCNACGYTW